MGENQNYKMTASERGLSLNLAGLFSIRMLGIFIILPIYAVFAQNELGRTGALAGLFISSYALTQLIMQPLVGALSDKIGRKITIIMGLVLFVIGSLIIAFTSNIYIAILGRIVQGSGAISAVILALASDLTRIEIRSKVMAIIGVSIGITFGFSVVVSTLIYSAFQGMGIFLLCALLGIIGIIVTHYQIPDPDKEATKIAIEDEKEDKRTGFLHAIHVSFVNNDINRLYLGGFMIHLVLTAAFTGFPFFLSQMGYGTENYGAWKVYLPSFLLSLFIMFILVGFAERFYQHRILFLSAIITLIVAFIVMCFQLSYLGVFIAMLLFFCGFNVMEATQPSLMSRFTPADKRGMIMGFFSSFQFLGASIGGLAGSILYGRLLSQYNNMIAYRSVFVLNVILLIVWFIVAYPMNNPIRKKQATKEGSTDE